MAVGKNKRLSKAGKKGGKKKIVDPFSRKEWYTVKAPSMFKNRNVGQTIVNRTAGTKIASEGLKGRVYEVSLGDLNTNDDEFRKFRLVCEEVNGRDCLTNFHGMSFTRDKLCSLVKKWQTLIEGHVDAKTEDGYQLRLFCIAFTKRHTGAVNKQIKKTTYAQHSQVRAIRTKMTDIMSREVTNCNLKTLVSKLIPNSIGKDIEKACESIFPLQDVHVRKVKVLKKPKFELSRLMEMHGDVTTTELKGEGDEAGIRIDRPEGYEPPVQDTV